MELSRLWCVQECSEKQTTCPGWLSNQLCYQWHLLVCRQKECTRSHKPSNHWLSGTGPTAADSTELCPTMWAPMPGCLGDSGTQPSEFLHGKESVSDERKGACTSYIQGNSGELVLFSLRPEMSSLLGTSPNQQEYGDVPNFNGNNTHFPEVPYLLMELKSPIKNWNWASTSLWRTLKCLAIEVLQSLFTWIIPESCSLDRQTEGWMDMLI